MADAVPSVAACNPTERERLQTVPAVRTIAPPRKTRMAVACNLKGQDDGVIRKSPR